MNISLNHIAAIFVLQQKVIMAGGIALECSTDELAKDAEKKGFIKFMTRDGSVMINPAAIVAENGDVVVCNGVAIVAPRSTNEKEYKAAGKAISENEKDLKEEILSECDKRIEAASKTKEPAKKKPAKKEPA